MKHVAASSALGFRQPPRPVRLGRTIDDPARPVRIPPSQRAGFPDVLVISEDLGTTATAAGALGAVGCTVEIARSGADALAIVRSRRFDFMLFDQQLPDMPGTDLIRVLQDEAAATRVPFILVSDSLTMRLAVEAIRLSAGGVAEILTDLDDLVAGRRHVRGPQPDETSRRPNGVMRVGTADGVTAQLPQTRPRSAAERWARIVLKACEADGDLKTLADWATFAGVSYSSLCETCRLVGVRPHDARDLARVLSAVIKAVAHRCDPSVLLDVSDRRTLRTLLEKAGLRSHEGPFSIEQFFRSQRFIASDNEGLNVLRGLLAAR